MSKEIEILQLAEEEKDLLHLYFTQNRDQKEDAINVLSELKNDERKIKYLKGLLKSGKQCNAPPNILKTILGGKCEKVDNAMQYDYKY